MSLDKKIEILSRVYRDSQKMITLADTKANISLTIQSLLITIGLGISILSNIFDDLQSLVSTNLAFVFLYFIIMIIFIISSIAGMISTIFVYKPRENFEENEKSRSGLLYFGDVLKYKSSNEYFSEVKKTNEEEMMREYSQQIYNLASILKKKFRFVTYSVYFLIFNTGITILFLVLSGFVHLYA